MKTENAYLKRRDVLRLGVAAPALASEAVALVFKPANAEKALFPAPELPGGGQMEIRMTVSGEHPDPDVLEVSRRLKPYDPESYYAEFQRVAEKNEALADQFEREGRRVTAHEFYLRAAGFYRSVVVYMAEKDPRMLPAYRKLEALFNKAWSIVPPPFERVQIPYEGRTLDAHFYPARTPPGQRMPVVFNYEGADGILLGGETAGGEYRTRGIAYLAVDGPGQSGTLRLKQLYARPDSERVAKAVVDYLISRPDVDANRIAIHGSSMAGTALLDASRWKSGSRRVPSVAERSACGKTSLIIIPQFRKGYVGLSEPEILSRRARKSPSSPWRDGRAKLNARCLSVTHLRTGSWIRGVRCACTTKLQTRRRA